MVTRASFSASAKVAADTGGPVTGAVPKAGGAPGVAGVEADGAGDDEGPGRHDAVAASMPI